jgi:iron-sulfur cluster repair protein YtfE (RIC family)
LLDAIGLLTKQHREAQEMIARLAGDEAGGGAKRELFAQLKDALTLHTRMEEEVFYPELEDFDETRALVEESYEEHRRVDQLLRRMSGAGGRAGGETGAGSSDWQGMLAELRDAVNHHVGEEEGEMFPRAAELLKPDRLRDMGYEMRRFETGQSESDQLIYPASRVGPA